MKTILLMHGPNLNLLGRRDKKHYGDVKLKDIEKMASNEAKKNSMKILTYQSNHEGCLIDWLQKNSDKADGIIINPGALTHYGYALHDALVDTGLPCIETHLSDITKREKWRKISVIKPACIKQIFGKNVKGYIEAVNILHNHFKNENNK